MLLLVYLLATRQHCRMDKYLYYSYVANQAEKEKDWHAAHHFWCLAKYFATNEWDSRSAELRAMDINEVHKLNSNEMKLK